MLPVNGVVSLQLARLQWHWQMLCCICLNRKLKGFGLLSASYIFEACYGINLHDFPFEKIALESRVASDAVKLIGSINADCLRLARGGICSTQAFESSA